MSFSFVAAGTPDQVRRQLDSQLSTIQSWTNNDTRQPEAVVELVKFHLDNTAFARGLLVDCNGHHDKENANLTLSMRSLYLPLEPAATQEDA